jgi:hypothetical protein
VRERYFIFYILKRQDIFFYIKRGNFEDFGGKRNSRVFSVGIIARVRLRLLWAFCSLGWALMGFLLLELIWVAIHQIVYGREGSRS